MSALWRELHALADRLQCRGVGSMEDRDEVREIANRARGRDLTELTRLARAAGVLSVGLTLADDDVWTCWLVGPGLANVLWTESTESAEAAVAEAVARWRHPSRQAAS